MFSVDIKFKLKCLVIFSHSTTFYITHMHQKLVHCNAPRRLAQSSCLCSLIMSPTEIYDIKFSALLCREHENEHAIFTISKNSKSIFRDRLRCYEIEDSLNQLILKILVIKVSLIKFIMHFNSFEWFFQPNDSFNIAGRMDCNLIWHVFKAAKR